jgi:2-phospho-L-lactate guanylyltransferase
VKQGRDIWAVIPVKETAGAKQRLARAVPPHLRQGLALAMLEDVLAAVVTARGLAGVALVTTDPAATALARRYGARILTDGACDGHTGAVTAAARTLAAEARGGMLQMPGDIPLVSADEISRVIALHGASPAFTIVPSHDDFGSNAVLVSPPTAVPLTFGDDSFFPHLRTAEAYGITPSIVRERGIGLDIDHPDDLARFTELRSNTRTQLFIERHGLAGSRHESSGAVA